MDVLTLKTEEKLPQVAIDGECYDLRLDMEYTQMLAHQSISKKIVAITKLEKLKVQDEVDLLKLIDLTMKMILKAPEEVVKKLTDLQKFQIMNVFNQQLKKYMDPQTATPKNMNN